MPAERRGAISFGNATNKTMAFNHTSAPTTSLFGSAVPASAPAPAPVAFGTTAPTTGGFQLTASGPHPTSNLFGTSTTPTAAPVPGAFGSTAPAFGATASAPAPPAFGFTAPAPTTSLFGASTPAPPAPPAFGATAAFGAAQAPSATNITVPKNLAGFMSYSSLQSDQKNTIDAVHDAIMNHKRTVLAVSTMAPKLLDKKSQQADIAAGQQNIVGLPVTLERLTGKVLQLEQQLKSLREGVLTTRQNYETTTRQAMYNAKIPTEFVAQKNGINITKENNNHSLSTNAQSTTQDKKAAKEFDRQLKALLGAEMNYTDQANRMPSPYLWKTLEKLGERYRLLRDKLGYLTSCLDISKEVSPEEFDVISVIQLQEQTIWKIANDLANVHTKIDQLRQLYNLHEKGENVLDRARQEEEIRHQQFNQQMRSMMVKNLPQPTIPASSNGAFGQPPSTGAFGGTPAAGGLFGSTPTVPAPAAGLFGTTTPAPATSLFGSTAASTFGAPASIGAFGQPPSTGAFGGTPAAGGLFGSTPTVPAPAAGLFGTATPAPATSLFGSTAASTPKSKSRRNNTRRR